MEIITEIISEIILENFLMNKQISKKLRYTTLIAITIFLEVIFVGIAISCSAVAGKIFCGLLAVAVFLLNLYFAVNVIRKN